MLNLSKIDTKERILQTALRLFNEKGYTQVSMKDIAGHTGMSPGNLAYHFKSKELLLQALYDRLEDERQHYLAEVMQLPTFEHAHEKTAAILSLTYRYRFFYLHTLDIARESRSVAEALRHHIEAHIVYLKGMLDYGVGAGNLQARPEGYHALAHTIWMVLFFYPLQQAIRHSQDDWRSARLRMWQLLLPYATEKGKGKIEKLIQNHHTS